MPTHAQINTIFIIVNICLYIRRACKLLDVPVFKIAYDKPLNAHTPDLYSPRVRFYAFRKMLRYFGGGDDVLISLILDLKILTEYKGLFENCLISNLKTNIEDSVDHLLESVWKENF